MSFATPLWLLLLGLLPLIVLLHAVSLRWKSLPVSSLLFWDRALKERRTSTRLRRILRNLLLLLQLLAAAGLAFALAGPRLYAGGFSSAGNIILVMDASASMQTREGERTRFDLARAQATRIVSGMRRGARMAIVAAAHSPRLIQPWSDDRQALDQTVAALTATDEPADISQSMLFALSLRDPRRGDSVALVSDCAFDALPGIDTSVPWMRIVRVGTPRENVGITALSLRRTLGGEEAYELFLSVKNYTASSLTVPVSVTAGQAAVLSENLALAPGEQRDISEPWRGPISGRIQARIDHRDDFPLDDQAYAVLAPARQVHVTIRGPGNQFLEQALSSLPGVVLRRGSPDQTGLTPLSTGPGASDSAPAPDITDVTVLDRVPDPTLGKGNYILIDTVPTDLPLEDSGELDSPQVTSWSRGSPLLASIQLGGLSIAQALRLSPGPGFTALAMSHDSPLMLSWDQPDLKVLVIGFDILHSDLPLRAAFPVLLANALDWFLPGWLSVQADQVQAGSPRPIAAATGAVSVTRPDGATETLPASGPSTDFLDTSEVGYYRVTSGSMTSEFAVNLASAEESAITPRFTVPQSTGSGEGQGAREAATGRPVWAAFALAALLALLSEWLLWLRSPQMRSAEATRGGRS